MTDRTIATIALVIAVVALAWAVVHSFIRDAAHGGPAHTMGIGNAQLPGAGSTAPGAAVITPPTVDRGTLTPSLAPNNLTLSVIG